MKSTQKLSQMSRSFLTLITLSLLFSISTIANNYNSNLPPSLKKIKKLDFFVDKQEVTYTDWWVVSDMAKFTQSIEIENSFNIDTNMFKTHYSESFKEGSFRETLIGRGNDFAIVGISPNDIDKFCKVRSEAVFLKYGKNIEFSLLDWNTYLYLKVNDDKFNISQNAPELITKDGEYHIVFADGTLKKYEEGDVFTFRNIARYK
jgi:hypothetical protein